jgi:hypothetical protein
MQVDCKPLDKLHLDQYPKGDNERSSPDYTGRNPPRKHGRDFKIVIFQ